MRLALAFAAFLVMLQPVSSITATAKDHSAIITMASVNDTLDLTEGKGRMSRRPDVKTAESCLYLRCGNPGETCCPEAPNCVCSSTECQCR
jgi:hypothetical protein